MSRLTIISGGQTGVDRAAFDAARQLGLRTGGYIPRGRWTEEGPLPEIYGGMMETESPGPAKRTKLNVRESDATLIITRGECEGGTLLTARTARSSGKPHLVVDLAQMKRSEAGEAILRWLESTRPRRLNVAGPRASKNPRLYQEAKSILVEVLGNFVSA